MYSNNFFAVDSGGMGKYEMDNYAVKIGEAFYQVVNHPRLRLVFGTIKPPQHIVFNAVAAK